MQHAEVDVFTLYQTTHGPKASPAPGLSTVLVWSDVVVGGAAGVSYTCEPLSL